MKAWRERFEEIASGKRSGSGCGHSPAMTSKAVAGGGVQFVEQCLLCGHQTGGPYAHRAVLKAHRFEDIPAFDQDLREAFRRQQLHEASVAWWDLYSDYLGSEEWKSRRVAAIDLAHGRCQHCMAPAEEVHHKTYANVGAEQQDDLVALCHACHVAEHAEQ